ncbi:MAG TPA: ATP-grasp domain-containing protein [Polyangiaceae bacterium]|jgi:biotin carboxylase
MSSVATRVAGSERRSLVVVLPATSYRGERFTQAAARLGVDLVLATDLPAAFARLDCRALRVDFTDPALAAQQVLDATTGRCDGALGTDEITALIAALIAERLGLPNNNPLGVRAARDKLLLRQLLAEAGIPQPAIRSIDPGENDGNFCSAFPCVVKPTMLTGSQGVIRADTPSELRAAISRVRAILERHPSASRADPDFFRLLVEEYIEGDEISVDALVTGVEFEMLAVFDKPDPLRGPFFEETLYVTPSRHSEPVLRDAIDVTGRAARALGLSHGAIHAELRIGSDGARLIEIAARSIGGLCSRALDLVTGNLEELLIAHAVGIALAPMEASGAAGVMMIPIGRGGVLKSASGIEGARSVPGVVDVAITIRPGEAVRPLPEGSSYLGFIFAQGELAVDVERALRAAHARLEFSWKPLLS